MAVIFEKLLLKEPNGFRLQFTNCCGAGDKGIEGYVGCRGCYDVIYKYFRVGEEEEFKEHISKPKILKRFEEYLEKDYDTYDEFHGAVMKEMGIS